MSDDQMVAAAVLAERQRIALRLAIMASDPGYYADTRIRAAVVAHTSFLAKAVRENRL